MSFRLAYNDYKYGRRSRRGSKALLDYDYVKYNNSEAYTERVNNFFSNKNY